MAAYILGHELRDCDELIPGPLKHGHQDLDSMDGRDRIALVFSIAVMQKNYVGQAVTQPAYNRAYDFAGVFRRPISARDIPKNRS